MEKTNSKSNILYRESLVGGVRERYDKKTAVIQVDPYTLSSGDLSNDRLLWPEVNYFDIMHFLIFEESAFTKDQLRNYKSLEAYKLFQDGWIREILHKEINGVHLLKAKVTHSMSIREKPLEPWVIVRADGSIDSAHCTCMAGLGECCSHVAAVLFALETSTRIRKEASVTDAPAYWMYPTAAKLDAPFKRLSEMNFQSTSKKRKLCSTESLVNKQNIPSPTRNEEAAFFHQLHKVMPTAAILSLTNTYSEQFQPKSLTESWPIDLSGLYDSKTSETDIEYEQLIDKCKAINICVSQEEARHVESKTREQSNSVFWHKYRTGRITASKFHAVCHTRPSQPSVSLIKSICYTAKSTKSMDCPAVEWGSKKEVTAKREYLAFMENRHTHFKLHSCGLVIHEKYPQFGASPDGFISCECCGSGCLEVKCPYSMKDKIKIDVPYLKPHDNILKLDRNHAYYSQIQTQLFLSNRQFCDFFVWCPQDYHYERIGQDTELWETMSVKAIEFHAKCIMPELVCKYFTKKQVLTPKTTNNSNSLDVVVTNNNSSNVTVSKYCICGGEDDGRKMILCENENCSKQWYHLDCITMKHVPKGKWLCKECK